MVNQLTSGSVMFRALLCLLIGCIAFLAPPSAASAADGDGVRPYLYLGAGGAYFDSPGEDARIEIDNPSEFPFTQFAIGANLNRHWGVEFAVNYTESALDEPGDTGRGSKGIGEYALWSFLGQARLRYPLLGDRLVPYGVLGAGVGVGEFNDRADNDIDFAGGRDASFIGAAGLGLEYFVAPNVALGVEAKHIFLFDTDVMLEGQTRELNLDHTVFSVGLRTFLDDPGDGGEDHRAGDRDGLRGYLIFRTGAAVLTDPEASPLVEAENPTRIDFGVGAGVNFDKHWGAEIVGDYYEPDLDAPGMGSVAELALWTVLGHIRYRYPVWDDRLVPYAVAGGGLGFAQINDRRQSEDTFPIKQTTTTSLIGSLGGGLEYFLNENVAVGVETRYLFGFDRDVTVGATTASMDNDTVLLTLGLRILLP